MDEFLKSLKSSVGISIIQTAVTVLIVWLWSLLMHFGADSFSNNQDVANWLTIPLIFMIVATLSAGAVLGYPLYLAVHDRKWWKAIALVLLTLLWLSIIVTIVVLTR
ncbi:MAG: hypothetical protein U9M89_01940 [Patescibacteria group bacterium]|nr:hypothetical protein [Patescibacteria group bacterium]